MLEGMEDASRRLVDAALANENAFAELVDRHKAMVYSIGHNFFQSRDVAEDIGQDVFLELFRHLDSIESDSHLAHWLRQATTRKCIDHARWRKSRALTSLEESPEPAVRPAAADPFLSATLRERLLALPERKRMIVILRFQEELELEEIARLLAMPVNTVKSTLHRALLVMKRRLGVVRSVYGGTGR